MPSDLSAAQFKWLHVLGAARGELDKLSSLPAGVLYSEHYQSIVKEMCCTVFEMLDPDVYPDFPPIGELMFPPEEP